MRRKKKLKNYSIATYADAVCRQDFNDQTKFHDLSLLKVLTVCNTFEKFT